MKGLSHSTVIQGLLRIVVLMSFAVSICTLVTAHAQMSTSPRLPLGSPPVDLAFVDLDSDGFAETLAVLVESCTTVTRTLSGVQFPTDTGSIMLFRVEPDGALWKLSETALYREVFYAEPGACGYKVCFQVEGLAGLSPVQLVTWGYTENAQNRLLAISERFGGIFDLGRVDGTPVLDETALYGGPSFWVKSRTDTRSFTAKPPTESVLLLNYSLFRTTRQVRDLLFATGDPSLALADLNGDGYSDILLVRREDRTLAAFRGDGGGAQRTPTGVTLSNFGASFGNPREPYRSIPVGGRGDEPRFVSTTTLSLYPSGYVKIGIVVAKGGILSSEVQILGCTKDGRLLVGDAVQATAQPRYAVWGDFNRDRRVDLLVAGAASLVMLPGAGASPEGLPRFSGKIPVGDVSLPAEVTGGSLMSVLDYDRDGVLDFVIANYGSSSVDIWRGNGDGTFARTYRLRLDAESRPVAVAVSDINRDGWPDIAFVARVTNDLAVALNIFGQGFRLIDPVRPPGRLIATCNVSGGNRCDIHATTYVVSEVSNESRSSATDVGGLQISTVDLVNVMYAHIVKRRATILSPSPSPQLIQYQDLDQLKLQEAIAKGIFTDTVARQLNMTIGSVSTETSETITPFNEVLWLEKDGQDPTEFLVIQKTSAPTPIPFIPTSGKQRPGPEDPRPYPYRGVTGDLDGDNVEEVVILYRGRVPTAESSLVAYKVFRVGPNREPWGWYSSAALVEIPYELSKYPEAGQPTPVEVVIGRFDRGVTRRQVGVIKGDALVEIVDVRVDVTARVNATSFLVSRIVGWGPFAGYPVCGVASDVNGDGVEDIVVGVEGAPGGVPLFVLLRNGTPFGESSAQLFDPVPVAVDGLEGVCQLLAEDLDGDGTREIVALAARSRSVVVLRVVGQTLQKVAAIQLEEIPVAATVRNLGIGDSAADLAVLTESGKIVIFSGRPGTGFSPAADFTCQGSQVCACAGSGACCDTACRPYWIGSWNCDTNGDGNPDLLVACGSPGVLDERPAIRVVNVGQCEKK